MTLLISKPCATCCVFLSFDPSFCSSHLLHIRLDLVDCGRIRTAASLKEIIPTDAEPRYPAMVAATKLKRACCISSRLIFSWIHLRILLSLTYNAVSAVAKFSERFLLFVNVSYHQANVQPSYLQGKTKGTTFL